MADLVPDASCQVQRVREFFLARQPILNRDQSIAAYELLFRSAAAGPAKVTDDLAATASVIAHASELGMENVIGASLAFVNVDAAVLMNDIVQFLPQEKVVLEILETVEVTDQVVARVAELRRAGYFFALDDVVAESGNVEKLLALVDIIKLDITDMSLGDLLRLSRRFKAANKKLLAEKVENLEQFRQCLELGFDYFQGYYFAKPHVLTGRKLSPSQVAIMQLMTQILSDADSAEIERSIKRDASLGFNILRLVNTPAVGMARHIDSIGQALVVLGRRQLQRWLQILLYAEPDKASSATVPLLVLATTRGKLLELLAERLHPGNRGVTDMAFTVGMLSLIDTLFGLPMEKILEQIKVAIEVREALLFRKGILGDMLTLVESTEHIEESGSTLVSLLNKLHLSSEQLYSLQVAAYEWSDSITRSTP